MVRNAMLARITLLVAGAFAPVRDGDMHMQRAFDLLTDANTRSEVALRGSEKLLTEVEAQWAKCKGDHRLRIVTHFRDKYTAHFGRPEKDVPFPKYSELFSFAAETSDVMGKLAQATGMRSADTLDEWSQGINNSAAAFWKALVPK